MVINIVLCTCWLCYASVYSTDILLYKTLVKPVLLYGDLEAGQTRREDPTSSEQMPDTYSKYQVARESDKPGSLAADRCGEAKYL